MRIQVSEDTARQDLDRLQKGFGSSGEGSKNDRAAQQLLNNIEILGRRLENTNIVKMLYLENSDAAQLLPESAITVAQELVDEKLTLAEATGQLNDLIAQYREVFKKMGITPAKINALHL